MGTDDRRNIMSWDFFYSLVRSHRVRLLSCALLLLIAACSREGKVSICSGDWWKPCKHFATSEDAGRYMAEEHQKDLAAARDLDIDYRKCAVVVLTAEIRKQHLNASQSIYISIIGEDPTSSVLASLAAAGIKAESASRRPKAAQSNVIVMSSDIGSFGFADIHRRWFGGYRAHAGYVCGGLCAGASEYRLEKSGDSCVIDSQSPLWVA